MAHRLPPSPRYRTPRHAGRTPLQQGTAAGTTAPQPPSPHAAAVMRIFDEYCRICPHIKPFLQDMAINLVARDEWLNAMVKEEHFKSKRSAVEYLYHTMLVNQPAPLTRRGRRGTL